MKNTEISDEKKEKEYLTSNHFPCEFNDKITIEQWEIEYPINANIYQQKKLFYR